MSQPVHVNSATGIVGPTGSGKSALLATAAEYAWETYKKITLLYTSDGGGFPSKIQALAKHGLIWIWRMRTRGEAFETTVRASAGWWPSQIDPRTGETKPNVRLVPPITERYTMSCPNGHVVKVVPVASALTAAVCPTCRTHVTRETMQVTKDIRRTPGFEKVGVAAFDGLSSMLSWQMQDMGRRTANLELKGEETALGGRIVSGDIALGGNNRAHYGFVQSRAEEMVGNSLGIPGLVLPPLWTMLLLETVDEGGLPVKGPKLAGKAKTDEAPAWFGNMLEVGVVKDEQGHDVRRLWLNEFIDDSGTRHLVKHRGGPNMPPFLQDTIDAPWSQVHLGVFFDLLAKDIEATAAEADEKYKDAPGLPVGEMTFGDAPTAPATSATSTAPATPSAPKPAVRPPAPRGAKPGPKAAPTPKAAPAPAAEPPDEAAVTAADPPSSSPEPSASQSEVAATPVTETSAQTSAAAAAPEPATEAAPVQAVEAPAPAPPKPLAAAPRPSPAGRPFAPPPAPRPPAAAPRPPVRVPGLIKR